MQCLGRTQTFQRCRKAARRLVCHAHRFQPWIALLTVVTTASALFGFSRDLLEPWQRTPPAATSAYRSPMPPRHLPTTVTSQEAPTESVLPPNAPSNVVRTAPEPASVATVGGTKTHRRRERNHQAANSQLTAPETAAHDKSHPSPKVALTDARLLLSAVGDGTALLEIIVDNFSDDVASIKRIRIESKRQSGGMCFESIHRPYEQALTLVWPTVTESALIDGWTVLGQDCVDVTGVLTIAGCSGTDQFDMGVPVQIDLTRQSRKRVTLKIKFVDLDDEPLLEAARLSGLSPDAIALSLFYAWPQMRVRLEIAGQDPSDWVNVDKEGTARGLK
jgi:hypothetical protein